jgi:hypothetical protein
MSGDPAHWQENKELAVVEAVLGAIVSVPSYTGKWFDFSGCQNLRVSISGTITAGTYDVLACDLIQKPLESDNAHPSLLQGMDGSKLNWMQFQAPPHWVKFITSSGFAGLLSCGATADRKDAWKR